VMLDEDAASALQP